MSKSLYDISFEIDSLVIALSQAADENGVIDPNHPALSEINILELLAADKAESTASYIEHLEAVAASAKAYYEELAKKHLVASRTAENRAKWLKGSILRYMLTKGMDSLTTDHYTFKIQNNGGVLPVKVESAFEVSVKELPESVIKDWPEDLYRMIFIADTDKIREAAKESRELPKGVTAERGEQLRIKGEK